MDNSSGVVRNELVLSFGPFRLIPNRQLLMRSDRPVKLGGRSFELLHLLAQRSGQLVSKDELMAAAWPDTFVHDSNLKVNMSSLRRSLGDTQTPPSYVATVAGRGYRFVAPVEISTAEFTDGGIPAKSSELPGLPLQRDIVGRDVEIANILAGLRNEQHVTVVGAGGIGKTTVAVAVARTFKSNCPDGVCFVDLSTVDDPAQVPFALAGAMGIRGNPGDTLAAVIDYLRQRRMLVVLDNCEHVLPGAAIFADKLAADRGKSRLLATSREPLDTSAEHIFWLDSLAFPDSGEILTATEALRFPAAELFARRASEWAGYDLVDADCAAIVQTCRSLDGLPLAIELAAAKLEHHKAQDVLSMLDQHLSFRSPHSGIAPPRQETLLATIDWSFQLLSQSEATVLRLVSVFAEAFELEDVVAVAAAAELTPANVTTGLGGLVAKSLVTAQVNGAGLRYRLLDSTRRYAIKRRQEDPVDTRALHCHAHRILDLLEQSEGEWDWRETNDWSGRYRSRLADLRAALSWAFGEGGETELGVRLTVAAIPLWSEVSLIAEAQERVELALRMAETIPCDDLLKAKLACSRAWSLFYARKLLNENEDAWLAAIAFAERAGNLDYRLRSLVGLSFYLLQIGQTARAIKCLEEVGELSRRHHWSAAPEGDRALAWARAQTGELRESRQVLDRLAATYSRPHGRARVAGLEVYRYIATRCYLPFVAWMNGHVDYAAAAAQDAVETAASVGNLIYQSNALGLAALPVSLWNGDMAALERYTARLRSNLQRENIARWVPVQRYFAAALRDLKGEQDAVRELRASTDELIECRYFMRIGMYLGHLANVLALRGRIDEASDTIAMALHYQTQQEERWCRSELQRIEASILYLAGHHSSAERLLRSALEEARAIGAASFELRIASDLAAHYINSDRYDDAERLLRPVYQSFSEGFTTKDLVTASQLLQRANAA
ncbi:winged helix-turn-helix domain-containing protein [Bradyrhizobium sp. Ai1a-2]|uniref:ATP-binding protein n=1 Tax=Bradyrhizobium sp. Ai1a-2 TaxID=196490 RepID=UPI00047FE71A|nr:winged helix-turn-helix domain-containing protein [Bradyrhizobium sp. Ai1a-2]